MGRVILAAPWPLSAGIDVSLSQCARSVTSSAALAAAGIAQSKQRKNCDRQAIAALRHPAHTAGQWASTDLTKAQPIARLLSAQTLRRGTLKLSLVTPCYEQDAVPESARRLRLLLNDLIGRRKVDSTSHAGPVDDGSNDTWTLIDELTRSSALFVGANVAQSRPSICPVGGSLQRGRRCRSAG